MSYLYVVGPHDPDMEMPTPAIKIGIATNPHNRLRSLQTGCPDRLTFYALWRFETDKETRSMEAACHRAFKQKRRVGEWFNTTCDEVKEYVHGRMNLNAKPKLCLYEPHH
nr:hypothetical protein RP007_00867 [Rhizobium sp. P007]